MIQVPSITVRVGTANHAKWMPWTTRIKKIAELMTSANADWWGTQETQEVGEKGILDNIEPKGTYVVWSDKVNITVVGRSDKYKKLWSREVAMPGDNRERYYQIVLAEDYETKIQILIVNTHFSNGKAWADVRIQQAKHIVATIRDLVRIGQITEETAIILKGDLNDKRRANEPSPAREFKLIGLIDARDVIGFPPTSIDQFYTRNIRMGDWTRVVTPSTVSDHDWFILTCLVGIGAPTKQVPIIPPPEAPKPITMYVRGAGDRVWKSKPLEFWNRLSPEKLGRVRKVPNQAIKGVVVQKWGGEYLETSNKNYYSTKYLTITPPKK